MDDATQHDQPSNVDGWRGRWFTRRRVLLIAAFVSLLILTSSTHVRIGFQSAAFLSEVFPDSPAYPARWFADEPRRTMVQFPHGDTYHGAYLYHPVERGCYGGIVMYIGLGPEHGDPHLDRVSRAFARNGISVLIPVSEPMVEFRLDANEHFIAGSAFEYLRDLPDVNPDRVGMFGISVGGAIVANAAQQESIRDDVAMIHSLGGYYDAQTVLAHMGVRAFEAGDGEWHDWEPSSATFRATRNSIVPLLPSDDRVAVWNLFGSDDTEIPPGLTEEGQAVAAVLVNRDRGRIPELLAELPEEVSAFLHEISPSAQIEDLSATTLLLHDRFDHVLPYGESVRFAADAEQAGHGDVYLTILEQFHHVRPDEEGDRLSLLGDGISLYWHIFRMHQSMDDRGWVSSPLDLAPLFPGRNECS